MQRVAGVRASAFWAANLLFDFALFSVRVFVCPPPDERAPGTMAVCSTRVSHSLLPHATPHPAPCAAHPHLQLPAALMLLLFTAFRLPAFSGQRLAAVAALLWGFAPAGLCLTYLLQMAFEVGAATINTLALQRQDFYNLSYC